MKAVNVNDVLKILHKYGTFIFVTDSKKYSDIENEIANLPSVTPKQRTGKWIQHGIGFRCSECAIQTSEHNVKSGLMKYCPNCGAKMEGENE